MNELSEVCFWDHCHDCDWPGCRCVCHREQVHDGFEWVEEDDDA